MGLAYYIWLVKLAEQPASSVGRFMAKSSYSHRGVTLYVTEVNKAVVFPAKSFTNLFITDDDL